MYNNFEKTKYNKFLIMMYCHYAFRRSLDVLFIILQKKKKKNISYCINKNETTSDLLRKYANLIYSN
jgi:hypothetical protein